jgi:hypothetical protein
VPHELHAVADAEDGDPHIEDLAVEARCTLGVDAIGPTGEDDASRLALLQILRGGARGQDLGIDLQLPQPAGDELCVLASEVEDDDAFAIQ